MQRMKVIVTSVVVLLSLQLSSAQDVTKQDAMSIETEREELLKKWSTDTLIKPNEVAKNAEVFLSKPIEEQTIEGLTELAKQTNAAANFIGFIVSEYSSYHRDNYRYEFVQKQVAPFHDAYSKLSNESKSYRNQCYFNLGSKYKAAGNEVMAFFHFRDAFRLSTFTEDKGDHKGTRYKAEIEMKKLLGLDEMGTFVYWKIQ